MKNLLPFLMRVIGARDPYAKGHSDHVTQLATSLANATGLTAEQTRILEFAAEIHDLGKIAINETVINKPGRFTEAEYIMVQHHPVLGANMIEPLDIDPLIRRIILHHHENFDGTGYPQKLSGEKIEIEARILRITDTYDALTHDRVYRAAYPHHRALEIMDSERRYFDPSILDLFFKLVSEPL